MSPPASPPPEERAVKARPIPSARGKFTGGKKRRSGYLYGDVKRKKTENLISQASRQSRLLAGKGEGERDRRERISPASRGRGERKG